MERSVVSNRQIGAVKRMPTSPRVCVGADLALSSEEVYAMWYVGV